MFYATLLLAGLPLVLTACQTTRDFYGSGPITLPVELEAHFNNVYLAGPGPAFYIIPVDGTAAYHSFCPAGTDMCQFELVGLDAITECEKDTGQKCFIFAEGHQIVWKGPVSFR